MIQWERSKRKEAKGVLRTLETVFVQIDRESISWIRRTLTRSFCWFNLRVRAHRSYLPQIFFHPQPHVNLVSNIGSNSSALWGRRVWGTSSRRWRSKSFRSSLIHRCKGSQSSTWHYPASLFLHHQLLPRRSISTRRLLFGRVSFSPSNSYIQIVAILVSAVVLPFVFLKLNYGGSCSWLLSPFSTWKAHFSSKTVSAVWRSIAWWNSYFFVIFSYFFLT